MKKVVPLAHLDLIRSLKGWTKYIAEQNQGETIHESGELSKEQIAKGESSKNIWTDVLQLAHAGDMAQIEQKYPGIYLRWKKKLQAERYFKTESLTKPLNEVNLWISGETDAGKSHAALELAFNAYLKEMNKWWDDYADEDDVIIEEVDKDNIEHLVGRFKKWTDKWAFPAEIKGGSIKKIRPRRVIVTSNYRIEQIFDGEDLDPMVRRFSYRHMRKSDRKSK